MAKCVRWLHEHITELLSYSTVMHPLVFQKLVLFTPLLYKKNKLCIGFLLAYCIYLKSTNTHSTISLFILGGKSKSMVTFSVRLLVRQSVQLRMDEITGEIRLN